MGLNLIHRSPGDTVQYNINGQLMNVVIPENLKAGDTFEVSVPVAIPTVAAICPIPLTVRGTQALVSFAPLAFKLFYAARQNAVLRRSSFPSP